MSGTSPQTCESYVMVLKRKHLQNFGMHQLVHASAFSCWSLHKRSPANIYDDPHVTILHHYIPFVLVRLQDPAHVLQKLQAVDLYCGCGGMSFIDQKTDKVHIKTQWAVDSVEAMCQSFQVNYPDATVSHGHALNRTLHAATGELFVSFKNKQNCLLSTLLLHNLNKVLRVAKMQGESLYCMKGIPCQTLRLSSQVTRGKFGSNA